MYQSPKLRSLTEKEITALASKPDINKVAVENFLFLMEYMSCYEASKLLEQEAKNCNWNAATRTAIRQGIDLAAKARKAGR